MLRQTPTSPAARLRAQTHRMGQRIASIQSGATSVMGPAIRQEVFTNTKSKKWRKKHNLSANATFEECVDAAHHLEPAVEGYVKKIVSSNNASMKALDKIIDDIPEDPVTKRLDEAEHTYIEQVTEVDNALEEIRKLDKNIERFSNSIIAATDAAQQANGLMELTGPEKCKDQDDQHAQRPTRKSKVDPGGKAFHAL